MRLDVALPDLSAILDGVEGDIAKCSTRAMQRATGSLKDGLRGQTTGAGFSLRLANTWRGETYPTRGQSITPAGYVWSNAPDIIDAFARGATIRPVNGGRYLWIPTKNVPRRYGKRPMTPEEVENSFNSDFTILPVKGGGLMAFIEVIRARNNRAERNATTRRRSQGREARLVAMFNLRRQAKMPKLLDLPGEADRAAGEYTIRLSEELARS